MALELGSARPLLIMFQRMIFLTKRPNHFPLLTLIVLFLTVLCLWPSTSWAQMGIQITIEREEGIEPETRWNAADCMSNTTVAFTLRSTAAIPGTVVFYRGDSCNTVEKRDGEGADCMELTGISRKTATLPDMRYENIDLNALEICVEGQEAPQEIWALIESTPGAGEDIMTNYGMIALTGDWSVPGAPTAVTAGTGSSAIPITWTADAVPGDHDGYRVYVDPSGCTADGESGILGLSEGGAAPTGNADIEAATGAAGASYNGEMSLTGGQRADVAVTSVDEAGNESPLSNVTCITRVQVDGFCERRPGGCPEEACSVSENDPSFTSLLFALCACLRIGRRKQV